MSAQDRGWGPGWPDCQPWNIVEIHPNGVEFPQGVHSKLAELVTIIVRACAKDGFEFVDGWCWGYACRAIAGTDVPSNHSWGLAVDVNAPANPYTTPWDRPTGEHAIPDWVGATFEYYGFRWGGPSYGDWMHMEFMGTPADAARQTDRAREDHADLFGVPLDPRFEDYLNRHPAVANFYGDPVQPAYPLPADEGYFQRFERYRDTPAWAHLYWTPKFGVCAVYGAIMARWGEMSWERGPLGLPVSSESDAPPETGFQRMTLFEHGWVGWKPGRTDAFI